MKPASVLVALAFALVSSTIARAADVTPQGLWMHAAVDGGVVGGDPVVGPELGVGFDTSPFSIHLVVPIELRLFDFPPTVDPALPAACKVIRCEEWLDGGTLSAETISRVVDSARVGQPGDLFHLKAGRLFATLGHAQLVDEYTNASDWDRRHSGVYVESNVPVAHTHVEAMAGDIVAPQNLVAARLTTSPMAPSREQEPDAGALTRFLGRFQVGLEFAGDFFAPLAPPDPNGDLVPGARTRPVLGIAADATWPLLDGDTFQIAPYLAASSNAGLAPIQPGFGGAAGLDVDVDAIFVALRANGAFLVDGPGHRTGVFDTLYDVDRRALFVSGGPTVVPGATLPENAGVGFDVGAEALVMSVVRFGARFHAPNTVEDRRAEAYVGVDAGSVRVDARIIQRNFEGVDVFFFDDRTYLIADAEWQFFAPFTVFARWQHQPRFENGIPQADDDVVLGASFDLVLSPG